MSLVLEKKITVQEFLEMDFEAGFLYELINGIIVKRASPSTEHQRISRHLSRIMDNFIFNNKLGEFFTAPLDVYLTDYDLAQPDLIFISKDNNIAIKNYIKGVPNLIVEILSPSTAKNDRGDKKTLYQKCGVTEYWIVDPKSQSVEIYVLKEGYYELVSFAQEDGIIESSVLTSFTIDIKNIFEF